MSKTTRMKMLGAAALALGLATACGSSPSSQVSGHSSAQPESSIMGVTGGMSMGKPLNQAVRPMTLVRSGHQVTINMYTEQRVVTIAPGVRWAGWTFDGTVPGPVVSLDQGDQVTLVLHNIDPNKPHSIDLHAAQIAPSANYVNVMPGQSRTIKFVANVPGVFMYHCATQPGLLHMEKGMYGEVVVQPSGSAWTGPAFNIVQSEFYSSMNALDNGSPKYVVFNGQANRYVEHPLYAKVGQPVHFAVVNAGPNNWSAFHVIGAILGTVQPSGSTQTVFHNLQTWSIAPGDGALMTVTFKQPGVYKFVTHSFRDVQKGAVGNVIVTP